MLQLQQYIGIAILFMLAACGGTTDIEGALNVTPDDPNVTVLGTIPTGIYFGINSGELIIDNSGSRTDPEEYFVIGEELENGFYGANVARDHVIYYDDPDEEGIAVAINSFGDIPNEEMFGIYIQRFDDAPTLPTGSFTFTGDYIGALTTLPGGGYSGSLLETSGTVNLTGSFDDMTISGRVTNHQTNISSETGSNLGDIILSAGTITDAGFEGRAENIRPDFSGGSGDYSGLFAGTDGSEVLGGLVIKFDAYDSEIGLFTATQDP